MVCDGFTGNIVLKVSESLVEMAEVLVRAALGEGAEGASAFERFRRRMDYSEYGGALLLGIAGPCVVGHGRSSAKAVTSAILLASRAGLDGLVTRLDRQLTEFEGSES